MIAFHRIIAGVKARVPGLSKTAFRVVGDAGYFSAEHNGKGLCVIVENMAFRNEDSVIARIVDELK